MSNTFTSVHEAITKIRAEQCEDGWHNLYGDEPGVPLGVSLLFEDGKPARLWSQIGEHDRIALDKALAEYGVAPVAMRGDWSYCEDGVTLTL